MNAASKPSMSPAALQLTPWHRVVLAVLGFWLSATLLLDGVVMPSLYGAGMTAQPEFASAGYSLFWVFNRVEILCGAAVLSGLLALRQGRREFGVVISGSRSRWAVGLATLLLAIALLYTYALTPALSAFGMEMSLNATTAMPAGMMPVQGLYWVLDALKLSAGMGLLALCCRDLRLTA
jgi:hypothetical protein